jgi:small subunit ribosomal protein S6
VGLYDPKGGFMRRYETIAIIDPDLSDDARKPVLERVSDLIPQMDGFLIEIDEWGAKKLAYEIKKKSRGYYVRFDFCGDGALVNEMERFFRIDDRVMKFMTVLLEKAADVQQIKEKLAEAQAELKQSEENPADAPEAGDDVQADPEDVKGAASEEPEAAAEEPEAAPEAPEPAPEAQPAASEVHEAETTNKE